MASGLFSVKDGKITKKKEEEEYQPSSWQDLPSAKSMVMDKLSTRTCSQCVTTQWPLFSMTTLGPHDDSDSDLDNRRRTIQLYGVVH